MAGGPGEGPALDVYQVPSGVAVHGALVYVADIFGNVVRRLDTTTGIETVVVGTAGTGAFAGDGGPATAAELASPECRCGR